MPTFNVIKNSLGIFCPEKTVTKKDTRVIIIEKYNKNSATVSSHTWDSEGAHYATVFISNKGKVLELKGNQSEGDPLPLVLTQALKGFWEMDPQYCRKRWWHDLTPEEQDILVKCLDVEDPASFRESMGKKEELSGISLHPPREWYRILRGKY